MTAKIKNKVIPIRLTEAQHNAIRECAASSGLAVAVYIRETVLGADRRTASLGDASNYRGIALK